MRKLNVLMIGPGTPDAQNSGVGLLVEGIRIAISSSVNLVSIEPEKQTPAEKTISRSEFTEKEVIQDIVRVAVNKSIDPYSYFESIDVQETKQIGSKVKRDYKQYTEQVVDSATKQDFDIIYAHDWVGMEAGMNLQETSGKPLVIHIHSLDSDRVGVNHKSWIFDLEKTAIAKAAAIIAVSEYTKARIVEVYGGDPEKIAVVHPAITKFPIPSKAAKQIDPTVLFFGRFAKQKRPEKFIEIAEKVLDSNPNVHFLMVGSGDSKIEIIESVARKNLGGKIHFADSVAHNEISKVFEKASVLCIPSDSEPFGLTAIEAATYGLPVVISEQSGAKEVLSAIITIDKEDINGFAKAIIKLLKEANYRNNVIAENKLDVDKHGWEKVSKNILEVLSDLVK